MGLTGVTQAVAEIFDAAGAVVLTAGFLWSLAAAARVWRVAGGGHAFRHLRASLGRVLLLGLEVLVAADLIRSVAVRPTLGDVAVLAVIVAIRTFLSFSLQVEMEGRLPWRLQRREPRHDGDDAPPTSP